MKSRRSSRTEHVGQGTAGHSCTFDGVGVRRPGVCSPLNLCPHGAPFCGASRLKRALECHPKEPRFNECPAVARGNPALRPVAETASKLYSSNASPADKGGQPPLLSKRPRRARGGGYVSEPNSPKPPQGNGNYAASPTAIRRGYRVGADRIASRVKRCHQRASCRGSAPASLGLARAASIGSPLPATSSAGVPVTAAQQRRSPGHATPAPGRRAHTQPLQRLEHREAAGAMARRHQHQQRAAKGGSSKF